MELLISQIVARVIWLATAYFHGLFYEVILDKKTEYSINPQMTKTELVPSNETKSTTNDIHRIKREAILQKRFLPYH